MTRLPGYMTWRAVLLLAAVAMTALLTPAPAAALPILADISSHRVEIHSAFTGTQLVVFGARNDPGDVVVVVRGPQRDFTVRRKERVAGIWVNRHEETFRDIPHFYRIAASRALDEVRQFRLFDPLAIRAPYRSAAAPENFAAALFAMLGEERLHSDRLGSIEFMGPTLFKAVFDFPDNMPRGMYTAEAYLFTDGALSGMHAIPVEVYKIGSDALIYRAAHEYSALYGVFAVLMALAIGGTASWVFNRIG